jgi:hypothetical protein
MALQKVYKGKRPRRESSNEIYVEEMSPDEMGYDGDVEILRPDQYEDAESDFEDHNPRKRLWPDTDDELAGRLRRLSCDPSLLDLQQPEDSARVGAKRQSKEMDVDDRASGPRRTEIEVSELVDGQAEQRPVKRRKRRGSKSNMAHRMGKKQPSKAWSDSSEKTEDQEVTIDSSLSGTPDVPSTPAPNDGDGDGDAMDLG